VGQLFGGFISFIYNRLPNGACPEPVEGSGQAQHHIHHRPPDIALLPRLLGLHTLRPGVDPLKLPALSKELVCFGYPALPYLDHIIENPSGRSLP
jgi:hypothetical protein